MSSERRTPSVWWIFLIVAVMAFVFAGLVAGVVAFWLGIEIG